MFTRFTIAAFALLLGLAFTACGDSPAESARDGAYSEGSMGSLSVSSDTSIVVAPRGTARIRVIYRDGDGEGEGQPVAGVVVEFALVGDAAAVSLSPVRSMLTSGWAQGVTDVNGEAVAQLTAGSDSAKFRVRASVEGIEPVYVDVEVQESATRDVTVSASYDGLRALVTRKVIALPGLGCEAARGLLATAMTGKQEHEDPAGNVTLELGPGLHYSLVAWGSDARGGTLAEGCSEIDVPVGPREKFDPVVIALRDRSLSLAGSYEVTLELDVARSAQRAGDTAVAGGQLLLTASNAAGADYFLDAIEAAMRKADKGPAADALSSARTSRNLDTSLQAELTAANVGPQVWLAKLGGEMQDRGSRLALKASYGVTSVAGVPMSLNLTGMQSRSADASRSLTYPSMLLPTILIDAQYDDARAVITVDTIRVQLPLGNYAGRLLDAIDAAEKGGIIGLLTNQAGCDELLTWSAKQPEIDACDEACLSAACEGAINALLVKARSKLNSLDVDHPSIGVRGELLVFDTDSDSIVDELGAAAFEGSWGKAPKTDQADSVDADFSVLRNIFPM